MFKINLTFSFEIGRPHTLNIVNGNSTGATWQRLRNLVKKRDNNQCYYCETYTPDGHVDHIVPISRGGTDAIDNLVWACSSCNTSKGGKTADEWLIGQSNLPQMNSPQLSLPTTLEAQIIEMDKAGYSLRHIAREALGVEQPGKPTFDKIRGILSKYENEPISHEYDI